jgi:predicted MPP superfamily phosphohydrolase
MLSFPRLVRHHVTHPGWDLPDLTIAVLSDLHVCRPWTPLGRVERIVAAVNGLGADLILLPGDFLMDRNLPGIPVHAGPIIDRLKPLTAPLGVAAVLGNHDWWDCRLSRRTDFARNSVAEALEGSAIVHLANRAMEIRHGEGSFWLVGIDSQVARRHLHQPGFHDPHAAFAKVPAGAAAILMAHEPDYFAEADHRAFLQISGHTHGGQANLLGWRPMTPSAFGSRYAWGHVRDGERHLVVSGGVGYSGVPLRILQPPEIVVVRVTGRG